jgi:hypothetical protein
MFYSKGGVRTLKGNSTPNDKDDAKLLGLMKKKLAGRVYKNERYPANLAQEVIPTPC